MEIGDINIYIYRCKKCSKPYHTTLHKNTPSNAINPVSASPDISQQDAAAVNTVGPQFALQPTLQMTSQVLLQAPSSKQIKVRALLDSGASISLVTNKVVQQLQLRKTPQNILISGAQGSNTGTSSHAVDAKLFSTHSKDIKLVLHASVVSKVPLQM